jgi:hypothetical protein
LLGNLERETNPAVLLRAGFGLDPNMLYLATGAKCI